MASLPTAGLPLGARCDLLLCQLIPQLARWYAVVTCGLDGCIAEPVPSARTRWSRSIVTFCAVSNETHAGQYAPLRCEPRRVATAEDH